MLETWHIYVHGLQRNFTYFACCAKYEIRSFQRFRRNSASARASSWMENIVVTCRLLADFVHSFVFRRSWQWVALQFLGYRDVWDFPHFQAEIRRSKESQECFSFTQSVPTTFGILVYFFAFKFFNTFIYINIISIAADNRICTGRCSQYILRQDKITLYIKGSTVTRREKKQYPNRMKRNYKLCASKKRQARD